MKISLNNIRLRNKMLIVYFICVLLPVVLTNVIFYNITASNIKNQKMKDISLAIEQLRNDFQDQIDVAIGISSVIYNDSIINQVLEEHYELQADYVDGYHDYLQPLLDKYSPVYKTIQTITIYTDNPTIVYGGKVQPITDAVRSEPWYQRLEGLSSTNPILLRGQTEQLGASHETISIVRRMTLPVGVSVAEKVLKIDLHPELMHQMFRNATLVGELYLLSGNKVYFSTDSKVQQGTEISESLLHQDGNVIIKEAGLGPALYLDGWRVVGRFQENEVLDEVRKSREFILYMAILNVLLPTLIIIWITQSMNQRIIRILKHMKRVKNHVFEPIPNKVTKDEIGQLTVEFNRMTQQIARLIEDVYVADIQKKELELNRNQAQLHALQSQINPHFLFNSLETIRMRSLMKKEEETARIISNLAKIFRRSLSWGMDRVTVRDEINLVISFLEIQKYRFGDKMNFSIDMDPEAGSILIPKMMLQPLVENASIHGIEPLKQQGLIQVQVRKEGARLICVVKDNGVGMTDEKLAELIARLEKTEEIGENVGVKNVRYRLKHYYGDSCSFRIESQRGAGTEITIVIEEER